MLIQSSKISRTVLCCLLLGAGLSACKRDQDPAAQGPAPTSATQPLKSKLPSDWPSQVPPYPGATIVTGLKMKDRETIVQRTNEPSAKVLEFYKTKLAGMRIVKSSDTGAGQSITWADNAQPPLLVTMKLGNGEAGKATFVSILLSHDEPGAATDVAPSAAGQAGAAPQ